MAQSQIKVRQLTKAEQTHKHQICELLKAEAEYQTRIRELEQRIVDTESFFGRQAREYQQKVPSIIVSQLVTFKK